MANHKWTDARKSDAAPGDGYCWKCKACAVEKSYARSGPKGGCIDMWRKDQYSEWASGKPPKCGSGNLSTS